MRQTRVSLVTMSRLRLAASGQDRVCPYPHVPRASDCLCFFVHNLPGQPHRCGGIGAYLRLHHTTSWRTFVKRKVRHLMIEKCATLGKSMGNDDRKVSHLLSDDGRGKLNSFIRGSHFRRRGPVKGGCIRGRKRPCTTLDGPIPTPALDGVPEGI